MEIFDLLKNNKGTTSSALGKELASKVISGDHSILQEAIKYVVFEIEKPESKSIRAGAAKILEIVSQKKPELVAPNLNNIKPALNAQEPQTRWMLMQTFGFCAKLNPKDAISVLNYSKQYLNENAGVCLSGAVHIYLGRIGATSSKIANKVLPILDDSLKSASVNEIDWILEGFFSIIDKLGAESKTLIQKNAELFLDSKKKSTQKRAQKILNKISYKY